ncbi:hypothetical protein DPF_0290 [Desulfoplanes formicivorans]|uniref:Uncharacterized protein n=2 Tax=Desulfoplanes formicivorans TaxID=1592317 RepID=A0A194AEH2_9BACT|nr:hypothetical protein DPF_0290 [Desulfoplanes formicivorans]
MIGIASEDDDGEQATHYNDTVEKKGGECTTRKNEIKNGKCNEKGEDIATKKQIETIEQMARERNLDVLEVMKKIFDPSINKIERLSKIQASKLISWMSQYQGKDSLEKAV